MALPNTRIAPTILKAEYAELHSTKIFEHSLPASSVSTTKEKAQYLSALRESVVKLQDEVNEFLTLKMDEDRILAASAGKKVDDKAEENYGEEMMDEME